MAQLKMKTDESGNYIEHFTRGYEITGDYFYVDDIIHICFDGKPELDYDGNPRLRHDTKKFQAFDEYYFYLEGDIYTQSCYFGWSVSDDIIEKYQIEENRLNRNSLLTDSIENHAWNLSEEIMKLVSEGESRQKLLKKMLDQLYKCNEPFEIKKVFEHYGSLIGRDIKIVLSIYFETKENAESLFLESVRQHCISDVFFMDILSCCKNPMLFVEQYKPSARAASTAWTYKNRAKLAAQAFADFENRIEKTRAYYNIAGFFVIATTIRADDGLGYVKYKVFKEFCDFANVLANDLSGVDLSKCVLEDVDFAQYKTDDKTVFPLSEKNIIYNLKKTFFDGRYSITQEWKDEYGVAQHSEHFEFEHFSDFIHFIGGNLEGSDFSLMPSDVYDRIRNTGICLSGIVTPEIYDDSSDISEFDETLQNEENSIAMLQLVRPKEGKLITSEFSAPHYEYDGGQILYISDLHLDNIIASSNCKTMGDVCAVLNRIGNELDESYQEYLDFLTDGNIVVLLDGDITHSPRLFELFLGMGFRFLKRAVIVLGNHELWAFPSLSVEEIISKYKDLCPVPVVHNEIILFVDDICAKNKAAQYTRYKAERISCDKAMAMSCEELSNQMLSARMIMLAGIGFSGCNQEFNADNGIYRSTLTRKQEIDESKKFDELYNHFISATKTVKDRVLVVATHMPLENWHQKSLYEDGIIYISGHTHRNFFHDDGVQRIYADNQNGYHGRHPSFKCVYTEDSYDPFLSYSDGIYEINKYDYILFYRAKKMSMQLNRDYAMIYMLKKNGNYCFLARLASGKLSILNGGRGSSLSVKDIGFYYDKMDKVISRLSAPLTRYTAVQKKISDAVKSIGGSGRIHGCIVDIDFYNHVYINPVDLTVTPYYALNMVYKWVFDSIPTLLEEHSPELFKNYKQMLESNSDFSLVPAEVSHLLSSQSVSEYFETDIYKASREISKMQKLNNNVLSFWDDNLLEPQDRYVKPLRIKYQRCELPASTKKESPERELSMPKESTENRTKRRYHERKYIGMTRKMNCGLSATVIEYKDCKNLTIQFENGIVKQGVRTDKFMEGKVSTKGGKFKQ